MEYETGEMGRGGAEECSAELVYRGRLGESFLAFTVERARWLGLRGRSMLDGLDVIVFVRGQEALVDSFEVTCSLGPIDAMVEDWSRREPDVSGPSLPTGENSQEF